MFAHGLMGLNFQEVLRCQGSDSHSARGAGSWQPLREKDLSLLPLKRKGKGACICGNTHCSRVLPVLPAFSWKETLTGCSLTEEEAAGV